MYSNNIHHKVSNGTTRSRSRFEGFTEETVTGLINKKLPKELLLRVFSYLDVVSLCRSAQVSRAWNVFALDGSNWQRVDLFDFQKDIKGPVIQSLSRRCGGFLKRLNLQGCQSIEDDALRTFAHQCKNIEELILRDCNRLTNRTCDSLSKYSSRLQHLDIESCTDIDDNGLLKLGEGCQKLRYLNISWCRKVSSEGLKAIGNGCPLLSILLLRGCLNLAVQFEILGPYQIVESKHRFPSKKENINNELKSSKIRDEGIQVIARSCSGLKKFVIQSCVNITDVGMKSISDHCKDLEFISLSGCDNLTDTTLRFLGEGCPELKTLEAARCSQFTDAGFLALTRGCHELQRMDLEECVLITDSTLNSLSYNCPRIQTLTLSHCELITDEGIRHLGGGQCAIEHLEVIELDNCPLITDASLDHLMHCQVLQRIELYDCHLITRGGIRRLKARLPNVRVQAYFAPVTPPPSAGNGRQRVCRCCRIL